MEEWVKYKEGTFTVEERIHSTREYRTKEQDPAKDIEDALKADLKKISDAFGSHPRTFQDMAYYGSVNSKRNTYHIYKYGESFLIMTNIRDKMNYNIYNFDELNEIMKYILDNGFYSRSFQVVILSILFPDSSQRRLVRKLCRTITSAIQKRD